MKIIKLGQTVFSCVECEATYFKENEINNIEAGHTLVIYLKDRDIENERQEVEYLPYDKTLSEGLEWKPAVNSEGKKNYRIWCENCCQGWIVPIKIKKLKNVLYTCDACGIVKLKEIEINKDLDRDVAFHKRRYYTIGDFFMEHNITLDNNECDNVAYEQSLYKGEIWLPED